VLFNSYEYLIYFLPVAALGFFFFGTRPRWAVRWLVVASLFFYGWWNPAHLPLIAASIGVNFWLARKIQRAANRHRWLVAGVAANLALLGLFKYADFILRTLAQAGLIAPVQLGLALPLGISFFTFTQIAFLVDVRRDKAREPSFDNYALFVTFFPHLLAGPIIHHSEMMPQFASTTNKRIDWHNVAAGLFLLAIGLAKKVFLADPLVPLVAAGFDHATTIGTSQAWLSALAYTLQIYFDFSGYTDMALGAALIFNIRLPINFDSPYRSLDLRDFWHRWHMTLSRFLREYLYVPLGGNRASESRVLANLLLTFLLGGLWHGAAWTFVFWGAYHGVGQCLGAYRRTTRAKRGLAPLAETPSRVWGQRILTFNLVCVGWVFFRADSLATAFSMLRQLITGWGGSTALVTPMVVGTIAFMLALQYAPHTTADRIVDRVAGLRPVAMGAVFAVTLFVIVTLGPQGVAPFIYFRF
jgi:D-alanyl-lipoteichoic acid acyltransferase DltB (MBOAT superfamily)